MAVEVENNQASSNESKPSVGITADFYRSESVIRGLFNAELVAHYPHETFAQLRGGVSMEDLTGDDGEIIASIGSDQSSFAALVKSPEHIRFIEMNPKAVRVAMGSKSFISAQEATKALIDRYGFVEGEPTPSVSLWVGKATMGHYQEIEADAFEDIKHNYPDQTRPALEKLINLTSGESESGRLILLHGEPGTGKTSFIRSLIRAWLPWCVTHLVTDPEWLFNDADYLYSLLNAGGSLPHKFRYDEEGNYRKPWKLIIAEDVNAELLGRGAGNAALSRLLNLTDGIFGQGSRSIMLFSTNTPLEKLAPALTRPGRLQASIEFPPFPASEASAWLGGAAPRGPLTLAELFELRRGGDLMEVGGTLMGQYL